MHLDSTEDWEEEKPDKFDRITPTQLLKTKTDLFKRAGILDEPIFDQRFGEFKFLNIALRNKEQTVPVTSKLYEYDNPDVPSFSVTCSIEDPLDAAILLKSRETDVVLQALETLIGFVESRLDRPLAPPTDNDPLNKEKAVSGEDKNEGDDYFKATLANRPGFLKRVIQLISSPYAGIRRRAVILFGSLSQVEETVEQLEKVDWLPNIAHLMTATTEAVVLDWIMLAFKNLSILETVQKSVMCGGLLEQFLDLVTFDNQDPDVVENTLESLINLSAHQDIREYLVLNGGFEAACELALSEFPSTQYHALRLLRELISAPVNGVVDRFHEADGMATIITILNTREFKNLHANTLEILEYLMGVPSVAKALSQKGIYEFLLDMTLSEECRNMEDVQAFALRTVARAAKFADERLMMNNCHLENKLFQVIKASSPDAFPVQAAAMEIIGHLAKTPTCRNRLRELLVVTVVMRSLKSRDPDVKKSAFFAAGCLMLHDKTFLDGFLSQDFLQELFVTLAEPRYLQIPSFLDQALACSVNLSETSTCKEAIEAFIVKYIPTWLAQPDEAVKIKALWCAAMFVRTTHAKEQFAKYKGYEILGSTLNNKCSDELIRNVCWAISILAIQRSVVIKIASSGCILPMLDARRSSNAVTRGYIVMALRRLAGLHLSFKYALLNELKPDDRIQHGFCDVGKLVGRKNFWSLKALLKVGRKLRQAVIFVSLPRKRFSGTTEIQSATSQIPSVSQPVPDSFAFDLMNKSKPRRRRAKLLQNAKPTASTAQRKRLGKKSEIRVNETAEKSDRERKPEICENLSAVKSNQTKHRQNKSVIPKDPDLQKIIKQVLLDIKIARTMREEIKVLADAVAQRMGGSLKSTAEKLPWENHLRQLAHKRQNFCLPLGAIECGSYCQRALLFKTLADRIHLPVSLVRGHEDRGWNEVYISENNSGSDEITVYIVDLVSNPGSLIPRDSEEAKTYITAPFRTDAKVDTLHSVEEEIESCFLKTSSIEPSDKISVLSDLHSPSEDYKQDKTSSSYFNEAIYTTSSEGKVGNQSKEDGLIVKGQGIKLSPISENQDTSLPEKFDYYKKPHCIPDLSKQVHIEGFMDSECFKSPQWSIRRKNMVSEMTAVNELIASKAAERKALSPEAPVVKKVSGTGVNIESKLKPLRTEKGIKQEKWEPRSRKFPSARPEDRCLKSTESFINTPLRASLDKVLMGTGKISKTDELKPANKQVRSGTKLKLIRRKNSMDSSTDSDVDEKVDLPLLEKESKVTFSESDDLDGYLFDEYEVRDRSWEILSQKEKDILERWEMDLEDNGSMDDASADGITLNDANSDNDA